MSDAPELVRDAPEGIVWHIGRAPDPWDWIPQQYAGNQRWDDALGAFRTVYAASSRYGCYVEVLAQYRKDPDMAAGMAAITVDPADASYETYPAGEIGMDWVSTRVISSAWVSGWFCDVTASKTIAALRPTFLPIARDLGLPDFDAAALKLATPRTLTQNVASFLYSQPTGIDGDPFAGVRFSSRHGDELQMWALFERNGDDPRSKSLDVVEQHRPDPDDDEELRRAMELHRLTWPDA